MNANNTLGYAFMNRFNPSYATALAIAILPLLTCCGNAEPSSGDGYKTVQLSYDYAGDNKRTREWRASMTAQDKCHQSGFGSAERAGPPEEACMQGSQNGCVSYHATQTYDCVGSSN